MESSSQVYLLHYDFSSISTEVRISAQKTLTHTLVSIWEEAFSTDNHGIVIPNSGKCKLLINCKKNMRRRQDLHLLWYKMVVYTNQYRFSVITIQYGNKVNLIINNSTSIFRWFQWYRHLGGLDALIQFSNWIRVFKTT